MLYTVFFRHLLRRHCRKRTYPVSQTPTKCRANLRSGIKLGISRRLEVARDAEQRVVLMTLLGGLGTLYGPVVGAVVVVAMQNYLAQYGLWVTVIQGAVFVACVLLFRRGIVGDIGRWAGWAL